MSSRFDRRPPSGSGSGSGSRGRRPFRDGSPPIRRDRDDSWGGRPENGSSDRRSSDRRPSDRRFSERRSGDAWVVIHHETDVDHVNLSRCQSRKGGGDRIVSS